jgi:hypothetical protein
MKKLALALTVSSLAIFASNAATAVENWTPYTDGIGIGGAAGALPPPGVYFQNTTYYADIKGHDTSGHNNGTHINAIVDVPVLLWAPDLKILGAQYAAAIVQPIDRVTTNTGGNSYTQAGRFETVVSPLNLSWQLPNDFYASTGLGIYIPDGTFHKNQNGAPPSSNFWAFEPSVGVSWLHNGWNLSAKLLADLNLKNTDTNYQSGHVADVDLTATKTWGKWTGGLGVYERYQFTDDQQNGLKVGDGNRAKEFGLGPVIGYNFGPVAIDAFYTQAVSWKNEAAGNRFFTRITVPL